MRLEKGFKAVTSEESAEEPQTITVGRGEGLCFNVFTVVFLLGGLEAPWELMATGVGSMGLWGLFLQFVCHLEKAPGSRTEGDLRKSPSVTVQGCHN